MPFSPDKTAPVTPLAPDRSAFVLSLLAAVSGALVVSILYNLHTPLRVDFDVDHPPPSYAVLGAGPSATIDGRPSTRVTTRIVFNLRGLDRRTAWRFSLDMRAPQGARRQVTIWADAAPAGTHQIDDRRTTIEQHIPAAPGRDGLVLAVFAAEPSGNAARDDAWLSAVRGTPVGLALPPPFVLVSSAVACACLALLLAWLGLPRMAVAGCVLGLALANGIALLHGVAAHTPIPATLVAIDVAALAAIVAARQLGMRGWHALAACVLSAVVLHLQLLVLLHPAVTHGDTLFHVHRLQVVEAGQLFFLSSGPGGEFPYPPALYVVVLLVRRVTGLATGEALRLTVAATTAGAGLLLYAVASAAWSGRRALFALVLYHALPIALGLQVLSFMTNAFGNALATGALALAAWTRERATAAWPAVLVATLLAVGAMLSHVSSAVILVGALGTSALLCAWARDRAGAVGMAVVLVVSTTAAVAAYYAHPTFRPVYARHLPGGSPAPGPAAAPAARPDEPPPQMRAEAHQTRWVPGWRALGVRAAAVPGYVRRYYGLAGAVLAMLGVLLVAPIRGSRFDRVVAGTLASCAAFLCLGVATPLDLRYYAAAYPFIAAAGGLGADRTLRPAPWLPRVLLGACLLVAAAEWYRWLFTPDL